MATVLDPFETLGLTPAFDLDLADAERRHRDLSRTLHPDRHAGRPAAERRRALGKAIEVNEAWRMLKDPVRRAEALLARLGLEVDEDQGPKPAPELLMEMMELREELAEAGRKHDRAALAALVARVKEREARALATLTAKFASVLAAGASNGAREPLLVTLGELRFCRRFLDEAGVLEDEIG